MNSLTFAKFMPIVIAEQRKALEQYRMIRIYINPKHVMELKCDRETIQWFPALYQGHPPDAFMRLGGVEIYEHSLVKEGMYIVMPDVAKMHPSDFWHGVFDETTPRTSLPRDTPFSGRQSDELHD